MKVNILVSIQYKYYFIIITLKHENLSINGKGNYTTM